MDQEQNTPTPESTFSPGAGENSKATLLMSGGIAVIILIALGWYMMRSANPETPTAVLPETGTSTATEATSTPNQNANGSTTQDAATAALSTQSNSDDLGSINSDLNATNMNSLNDTNKI